MKDYKRLTDRVIAEMLRNTEEESWDSDNLEAQCYIRLAELEDKIESGELVDRNEYLDRLMAAKDISGMTDKEIEFFAKHNARVRENADAEIARLTAEVRKQTMEECLRILRDIDGQGTTEPFWVGWSEAIIAAIKEISKRR